MLGVTAGVQNSFSCSTKGRIEEYYKHHELNQHISVAVNSILAKRPSDPWNAMIDELSCLTPDQPVLAGLRARPLPQGGAQMSVLTRLRGIIAPLHQARFNARIFTDRLPEPDSPPPEGEEEGMDFDAAGFLSRRINPVIIGKNVTDLGCLYEAVEKGISDAEVEGQVFGRRELLAASLHAEFFQAVLNAKDVSAAQYFHDNLFSPNEISEMSVEMFWPTLCREIFNTGHLTVLACLDMHIDPVVNEGNPDMVMISVGQDADKQSASPPHIIDLAWGILGQMLEKVASTELVEPPPAAAKGKKGEPPPEPPKGPSLEELLPKIIEACAEVLRQVEGGVGAKNSFGIAVAFNAEAAWDDETKTYDVNLESGLSTQELAEFWDRCATAAGESLWLLAHPFRQADAAAASEFRLLHPASISVAMPPDHKGETAESLITAGRASPSWSRLCAYDTFPDYGLISMPEDPEVFQILAQHATSCPVFAMHNSCEGRRFLRIGNAVPDEFVSAFSRTIGHHFENQVSETS